MIFNIQRFSTHDGAGIRTIIFFKGCSLRCPWCENPESQSFEPELAWDERKCIRCLECAGAAVDGQVTVEKGRPVFHREKIRLPESIADACPSGALSVLGAEKSIQEIMSEIEKDTPFYKKSRGGVTLSGGEPYNQPVFLLELLEALGRSGLTAAVETALSVPWSAIEPSLPFVEAFLVDVKHSDAAKLKAFTGADISLIEGNLRRLEKSGAAVTVRIPVVPGFNDSIPEIAGIVDLAASLRNVRMIHFLPFHTLGVGKYRLLGKEYRFRGEAEPAHDMSEYLALAQSRGLDASIGG
ncbi:MAG TPA: glycyl-radical enzyme activating protein [Spirochaetia bacterium]|nr:glycyl-radical enzyme activating protein [Spirochaetia bacterium]